MRIDWLKRLRNKCGLPFVQAIKASRKSRHDRIAKIETLESICLLSANAYVYPYSPQGIVEGSDLNLTISVMGMDTDFPATLHYRIENTGGGLNGTAYEDDFDGTIDFTAAMQMTSLQIPTNDNLLDELPRHFRVSFAPGDGMGYVNPSTVEVTVFDNDYDSANAYQITTIDIPEGLTFTLPNPSGSNNPVFYNSTSGTAEYEDYLIYPDYLPYNWYPVGINFATTDDLIDEYNESVSVFVSAYLPATEQQWSNGHYDTYAPWTSEYIVNIIDDDAPARVFLDPSNSENVDASSAWFGNIVVDGPTEKTISVDVNTADGASLTPARAGVDYVAASQTLTITGTALVPGYIVSSPISVSTSQPTGGIYPKDFFVSLSNPVDVVLSQTNPTVQTIYIEGFGSHAPVFGPDTYDIQVPSFTSAGDVVGWVGATDQDLGDILTYSGAGTRSGVMPDGSIVMSMSTGGPFSQYDETYTITVTDSTGLTDTVQLHVHYGFFCGTGDQPGEIRVEVLSTSGVHAGEWVEISDAIQHTGDLWYPDGPTVNNPDALVIDFGNTPVGVSAQRQFRITNLGLGTLFVPDDLLGIPSGFSLPNGLPDEELDPSPSPFSNPIVPGESMTFNLQLDADDGGIFNGLFRIFSNDGNDLHVVNGVWRDGIEKPFDIQVTGHVGGPEIQIDVSEVANRYSYVGWPHNSVEDGVTILDYGTASTGDVARTLYLRVTNAGTETLNLGTNDPQDTAHQITLPDGYITTLPEHLSVQPGAFYNFTVSFIPSDGGHFKGDLVIPNNDLDEAPFSIHLDALVDEPELRVSMVNTDGSLTPINDGAGSLQFGQLIDVTGDIRQTLRVENTGTQSLTFQYFTHVGDFTFLPSWAPGLGIVSIAPGTSRDFEIEFDCSGLPMGSYTGHIHFTDNDANENTFDMGLNGEIIAPEVAVSMLDDMHNLMQSVSDGATLSLGSQTPGMALMRYFEVKNVGTGNLLLQPVSISGAPTYSLSSTISSGQPLGPGETAEFAVMFDSAEGGTYSSSVSFATNDSDENPFNFSFTTNAGPEIEVSLAGTSLVDGSSSIDFGSTVAGVGVSKTFTVRNLGSSTLTLSSIDTAMLPADFTVTVPGSLTLSPAGSPGDSTTFSVTLNSINRGIPFGQISLLSDDYSESSFEINVSGHVHAPELQLYVDGFMVADGDTVEFGSTGIDQPISRTFTFYNAGEVALSLPSAGRFISGGYSLSGTIPSSLLPGASTSFDVILNAQDGGHNQGEFRQNNNDPLHTPFNLSLSGTVDYQEISVIWDTSIDVAILDGVSADSGTAINLGTVPVSSTQSRTFVVSNTGTQPLTLQPFNLTGVGFAISSNLSNDQTLLPGDQAAFSIEFTPTEGAIYRGAITFLNDDLNESPFDFEFFAIGNGPEIAVTETGELTELISGTSIIDFGVIDGGTNASKTFVVSNRGIQSLHLDSATLPSNSGFSLTPNITTQDLDAFDLLAGGTADSTTFTVVFNAVSRGYYETTLTFDNSDSSEGPFNLTLRGQVKSPEIRVQVDGVEYQDGGILDFGTVSAGEPESKTITVYNDGDRPLVLNSQTVPTTRGYSSTFSGPRSVQPSESYQFVVTQDATEGGTKTGAYRLVNTDQNENPFDLTFTALVTSPEISVEWNNNGTWIPLVDSASSINFGVAIIGQTATRTFRVRNDGSQQPLDVEALTLPAGFLLSGAAPTGVLAPGASTEFTIGLDTSVAQAPQGDAVLVNNDFNEDPFTFSLSGIVVDHIPEISVSYFDGGEFQSGGILEFGTTFVGEQIQKVLQIANIGDADLTLSVPLSVNGYDIVVAGASLDGFGNQLLTLSPTSTALTTLTLTANSVSFFDESLILTCNDLDESNFDLRLIGEVRDNSDVIIIDNGDPAFETSGGAWGSEAAKLVGYQEDYLVSSFDDDVQGGTATWTFSGLDDGQYRVSATWMSRDQYARPAGSATKDSTAQYAIYQGSPDELFPQKLAAAALNQRSGPDDFEYAGVGWEDIGVVAIHDGTLSVRLSAADQASRLWVYADAIRIERLRGQYDLIQLPAGRDVYHFDVRKNDAVDGDLDVRLGDTATTHLTSGETPKVLTVNQIGDSSGVALTQNGNVWSTSSGTTITINADGSQTYRPANPFEPDLVNFTYMLDEDPHGVLNFNNSPVALDDTFTTSHGHSITFDPRANDFDPQGDLLAANIQGVAAGHFVVDGANRDVVDDRRLAIEVKRGTSWDLTLNWGTVSMSVGTIEDHTQLKERILALPGLPAGLVVNTWTAKDFTRNDPDYRLFGVEFQNFPAGMRIEAAIASPIPEDSQVVERGTLTAHPNGTFTYVPNQTFSRVHGEYVEQFLYTVNEAANQSQISLQPATINISVTNETPYVAAAEGFRFIYTEGEDNTYRVNLGAYDDDGDELEYVFVEGGDGVDAANGNTLIDRDGGFVFTAVTPAYRNELKYRIFDGQTYSGVLRTLVQVVDSENASLVDGAIAGAFFNDPNQLNPGDGWRLTGASADDRRLSTASELLGSAMIDMNAGVLQVVQSVDLDLRQSTQTDGRYRLKYQSQAADRQPIIHARLHSSDSRYQVDNTDQVQVELRWYRLTDSGRDDMVGGDYSGADLVFNTTTTNVLPDADDYEFAIQTGLENNISLAEKFGPGVYIWEVDVTATFVPKPSVGFGGSHTRTLKTSGSMLLTDDDAAIGNPFKGFGNGWELAGVPTVMMTPRDRALARSYEVDSMAVLKTPSGDEVLFVTQGINALTLGATAWRAVDPATGTALAKDRGSFTYDVLTNTWLYLATDGSLSTYDAPTNGQANYLQLREIDPLTGPSTTFSYFPDGRIQSMLFSDGSTTTFAYTATGELDAIQMPGGRTLDVTVQPGVDANSSELTGLSIGNYTRSFGYDGNHQMISDISGAGSEQVETRIGYDSTGLVSSVTLGSGATESTYLIRPGSRYTPDSTTNQLPVVFAGSEFNVGELIIPTSDLEGLDAGSGQLLDYGLRRYYFFDDHGRPVQESLYATSFVAAPDVPDLLGDPISTEFWVWDNFDNVRYYTDSAGRETRYTYDYNIVGQAGPIFNKLVEEFRYYRQASYQYESTHGWLVGETDANGDSTGYYRHANGLIAVVTGPESHFEVNTWGSFGGQDDLLLSHDDITASLDLTFPPVLNYRNLTTNYTYDGNRRVLTASTIDSVSTETQTTTYTYANPAVNPWVDEVNVGGATSSVRSRSVVTYDALDRPTLVELFDAGGSTLLRRNETEYSSNGLISAQEDGDEIRTEFEYDSRGFQTSIEIGAQNPSTSEITAMDYFANGGLKTQFAADGHAKYFYYDPKNRTEASLMDRVFLSWSSGGSPVFADGIVVTTRDIAGNVITIENRLSGLTTSFDYDHLDRIVRQTQAGVQTSASGSSTTSIVTTSNFDAVSNQVQAVNAEGVAIASDFNGQGNRSFSAVVVNGAFSNASARQTFGFDSDGIGNRATEYRTAAGITSKATHDGFGRLRSQIDPDGLGATVTYAFDTTENLTRVTTTDRNGVVTIQLFDSAGQLRTSINAAGDRYESTYSLAGRLERETIRENATSGLTTIRKTEFGYDDLGRQDSVKRYSDVGAGTYLETTVLYDFGVSGRRIRTTDPANNQTVTEQDSVGNVTRITQPSPGTGPGGTAPHAAPVTTFVYDYAGLNSTPLTTVMAIDPQLHSTQNVSNVLGWLLESYDAGGKRQVANDYDLVGRVIKTADAHGNYSKMEYYKATGLVESVSVPVAESAPIGASTRYEYDASGNRTKLTDPENNVTTWDYDDLNRVISETIATAVFTSDTTYVTAPATRTWDHSTPLETVYTDRNGRVTTYTSHPSLRTATETWSDGRSITHTFNAVGELVNSKDEMGTDTWTQSYDYNALGWLMQDTFEAAGAGGAIYQTEANHHYTVTGVRDDLDYRFEGVQQLHQAAQVDGLDRIWKLTQTTPANPTGLEVTFTYRADSSLDSLQRSSYPGSTSSPVSISKFAYFNNGDLQQIDHQLGSGGTSIAKYDFLYDDSHRLTEFGSLTDGANHFDYDAQDQLQSASLHAENYSYDNNGNRTNAGYATGPHNLLIEDADYNYRYDAEGNRTKRIDKVTGDTVEYVWDHRNRLVRIDFRSGVDEFQQRIEYEYNVNNLRIAKRVYTVEVGPTNNVQQFAYDGSDVVLTFDEANAVEHTYFHGPSVDQIFADEDSLGQVLWALTDHQGSVRDWVDNSGTVAHHTQYSSFGEILSTTNPSTLPTYAYTGREWDPDANLYYYRARWYDPVVGRFVGDDSSGFGAGDANLQRYVGNNSPNSTDPSGLKSWYLTLGGWRTFASSLTEQGVDTSEDLVGGGWAVVSNLWSDNGAASAFGGSFDSRGRRLGDRVYRVASNNAGRNLGTSDYGKLIFAGTQEFVGANSLAEGIHAVDLETLQRIEGTDRLQRTLSGGGGILLAGTSAYVATTGTITRLSNLGRGPASLKVNPSAGVLLVEEGEFGSSVIIVGTPSSEIGTFTGIVTADSASAGSSTILVSQTPTRVGGSLITVSAARELAGTQQGAAMLQARANLLYDARGAHGDTVTLMRARHAFSGEDATFIGLNGPQKTAPAIWSLRPDEVFIPGRGRGIHAEENVLRSPMTDEWFFLEGGTSRNVCDPARCGRIIENSGMQLGGDPFKLGKQNTPYRQFWRR